jgi:hypothetical protein
VTIQEAFALDGFTVVREVEFHGRKGYRAEHTTAVNVKTGRKKFALAVEGDGYEMGYLTALLAPDSVEAMGTDFLLNIAPSFIGFDPDSVCLLFRWLVKLLLPFLKRALVDVAYELSEEMYKDVPVDLKLEMQGLADGLKEARPRTKVSYKEIWALNAGIDCLLSIIYSPDSFLRGLPRLLAGHLRLPLACNGFMVFGNALEPGLRGNAHFFGRDFMFPTAHVFQDEACLIVYRPTDDRLPLASGTAPGFVGSITAMNRQGIGIGVDMAASGHCDAARAGYNAILLVRGAAHAAASAEEALAYMVAARRGCSWDYLIADGAHDRDVVAEAGMSTTDLDPVSYPPEDLQKFALLPDAMELAAHDSMPLASGLAARWNDSHYSAAFIAYNSELFGKFGKHYDVSMMGERGYIGRWVDGKVEQNCPEGFYFAPQREDKDDVLIATNHFISPSLRLCAMDPWANWLTRGHDADIQWRYDRLNDLILGAYGAINEAEAWRFVNFISADEGGITPDYYASAADIEYIDSEGHVRTTKEIGGMTSLLELKSLTIRSRYGYYADEPVTITLPNYTD